MKKEEKKSFIQCCILGAIDGILTQGIREQKLSSIFAGYLRLW